MATHLSTIVSRKPADILAHISRLRPTISKHSLLYAISASQHTDPSELSQLVSSVKGSANDSVGCLTAPIPSERRSWQRYTSVSLAAFDPQHATLFRSTIPGRKASQVGRWHALHQKEAVPDSRDYSREINWENALARTYESDSLPPELQGLSDDGVDSVIYMSDAAPEGLNSALSRYTSATKLGLVATLTPFVTGRPVTLFHNESVHSEGAVGLCLSSATRATHYSDFPGLEAITQPMTVTEAEGNLVNSLDGANPSRLLLHALQNNASISSRDQNISKELQLYMGTIERRNGRHEVLQLFYVTSGDPSRGSLALDTDTAPPAGALVQMFWLPPHLRPDVLGQVQKGAQPRTLTFATTSIEDLHASSISGANSTGDGADTIVLPDAFLAASENGCIVSRRAAEKKSERPWKCIVPGGLVGLRW